MDFGEGLDLLIGSRAHGLILMEGFAFGGEVLLEQLDSVSELGFGHNIIISHRCIWFYG